MMGANMAIDWTQDPNSNLLYDPNGDLNNNSSWQNPDGTPWDGTTTSGGTGWTNTPGNDALAIAPVELDPVSAYIQSGNAKAAQEQQMRTIYQGYLNTQLQSVIAAANSDRAQQDAHFMATLSANYDALVAEIENNNAKLELAQRDQYARSTGWQVGGMPGSGSAIKPVGLPARPSYQPGAAMGAAGRPGMPAMAAAPRVTQATRPQGFLSNIGPSAPGVAGFPGMDPAYAAANGFSGGGWGTPDNPVSRVAYEAGFDIGGADPMQPREGFAFHRVPSAQPFAWATPDQMDSQQRRAYEQWLANPYSQVLAPSDSSFGGQAWDPSQGGYSDYSGNFPDQGGASEPTYNYGDMVGNEIYTGSPGGEGDPNNWMQAEDWFAAAKGFHGVVRKPTHILAGEAGPEKVSITPMRGKSLMHSLAQGRRY